MRITQNSVYTSLGYTLENIQSRLTQNQNRISTGKQIQNLSDNPVHVGEIQDFTAIIKRNTSFKENIAEATTELQNAHDVMQNFGDIMSEAKIMGLDALKPTNFDKLPVFATQIRGLLTDMVNQANHELNGHYLFAGTKTTASSITPTPPETTKLPFEIVQDAPSATNPSGLRVSFKGNLEDRAMNRSATASEVINVKADAAFGAGGTEAFTNIINLYNTLAYNSNGSLRQPSDVPTPTEAQSMQNSILSIGTSFDKITETTAIVGEKLNRFDMISSQIVEENTRLSALRSEREDTDIARSALDLRREETALQYTMQVGSKLVQQSLFDFLR